MPRNYARASVEQLIWRSLRIGNGCWEWAGSMDGRGYGRIRLTNEDGVQRTTGAHRAVYEYFSGPIPEGLEIDHLCRNPRCVRPDHMEAVTHAENMVRMGVHHRSDRCAKGHLLVGRNLAPRGVQRPTCRECKRERWRRTLSTNKATGLCSCGRVRTDPAKHCCSVCRERALTKYYSTKPVPKKEK